MLDKLELVVLPFVVGGGMRLTDSLDSDIGLTFESSRAPAGGSVEIVYTVSARGGVSQAREAGWVPASQRSGRGLRQGLTAGGWTGPEIL